MNALPVASWSAARRGGLPLSEPNSRLWLCYSIPRRLRRSQEQAGATNDTQYVLILEKGANSFGAYVPDLPGCAVVGEAREEALQLIREAVELHIATMRE